MQGSVSRRQFLKISAGTVAAVTVADKVLALTALQPVIEVGNPLGLPGSVLGACVSRPVSVRLILYLVLLPERHARLSRPGLRPERRRHAGGAELRPPNL